jgi:hypothetical protein
MFLKGDGRTRMYIRELKESQELVLGRGFVIRQMSWSQDKPALLPRLDERTTTLKKRAVGLR